MKTTSYQRNNRPPLLGVFLGVFFLLALLFGINYLTGGTLSTSARSGAGAARAFVASVQESVSGSGFFTSRASLERENQELRREIALHAEEIAQTEFLRAENEALRGMALLAEDEPGITARTLSPFSSTPYGTFLIDAGSADGVREKAMVLSPGGYVLGEVASVGATSASVRTLFAPGNTIAAVIGTNALPVEGRGGGNAHAVVPRESAVREGDIVRIPQLGGRPAGLVGKIESASTSATADIYIRIPINLDTLRFVYVVSQ